MTFHGLEDSIIKITAHSLCVLQEIIMHTYWKYYISRFLLCFIAGVVLVGSFFYYAVYTQKKQASIAANNTMYQLRYILAEKINKTHTLAALLVSRDEKIMREIYNDPFGQIFLAEFNDIANILRDNEAIRALQLLPKGVVTYTFPYESNKAAIGDNVLQRESRKKDALTSMKSRKMRISGPLTLKQGGQALIARNPLYFKDGTFWGFSAIVLDLPDILVPLGLDSLSVQGYNYKLYWMENGENRLITSNLPENPQKTVMAELGILNKVWRLEIVPKNGWYDMPTIVRRLLIIAFVSAFVAYYITKSHAAAIETQKALEQEKKAREVAVQAYKVADQANSAKSTFLSTICHDIRTPMNAIVGLCNLLEMDYDKKEKVLEYTRKINASSQHLLGLINDVLDMSKIESGKTSLNLQKFNLAKVIDELNIIVRPQAEQKKQLFEIKTKNIVHEFIIGDKLRINQILLNLLSNAVKYTPAGGTVFLEIEEILQPSDNITQLQFIVKDSGIGMSEEFQQKIFEPFSRAIDGRVDKIQGTGLGMAITKNLIDLMGGTIDISSAINQGTTITLNLKLKVEEVGNNHAFFAKHGISRILVADDEEDVYATIHGALKELKIEIDYADSAEKAMECIYAHEAGYYHLIILDWKMPQTNGILLASMIRKIDFDVPIFLLSSYDWTDMEKEALASGINGFLQKPFFLTNLKNALEHLNSRATFNLKSLSLEGMKLLAAEDNEINSQILVNILEKLGAVCDVCENGKEAVEKFETSPAGTYDLILMDIQMPVMNGLEATKRIRGSQNPDAAEIPVVAMTANAFPDDVKAAFLAGMNAHIPKPININLLVSTVRELVKK